MFYKKVGIEGNGVSAEDTLQKLAHKTFHRDDMGDAQKGSFAIQLRSSVCGF